MIAPASRFDAKTNAWALSRYADVYAALREPSLAQATAQEEATDVDPAQLHAGLHDDLARLNSAECRERMERSASETIAGVSHGQPIDLVKDVVWPWCASLTESEAQLREIAKHIFYKGNDQLGPGARRTVGRALRNRWFSWRGKKAEREMNRLDRRGGLGMSKPMFLGLTQTLPSFLANAWLALLNHEDEMEKLRGQPELMPGAIEELLRFAGIVHTLRRRAADTVHIGEARIEQSQNVILRVASANFDSAKFQEPERLDLSRRPSGHLGLGTGAYACAGAALVRTVFGIVTPLFLAAGPRLVPGSKVIWVSDSSIRWPRVVRVRLGHRP